MEKGEKGGGRGKGEIKSMPSPGIKLLAFFLGGP